MWDLETLHSLYLQLPLLYGLILVVAQKTRGQSHRKESWQEAESGPDTGPGMETMLTPGQQR